MHTPFRVQEESDYQRSVRVRSCNDPYLLTVREAAAELALSARHLKRLIVNGAGPKAITEYALQSFLLRLLARCRLVIAWRITSVAMQPLWPLALM
jgi:hypothetical protein